MISTTDPVYVVKEELIYGSIEYVIAVASSREHAIDIIKAQIKYVDSAYNYYRYSIERWLLNERYGGLTTESITKEQNIEWAKELGVYYD